MEGTIGVEVVSAHLLNFWQQKDVRSIQINFLLTDKLQMQDYWTRYFDFLSQQISLQIAEKDELVENELMQGLVRIKKKKKRAKKVTPP